MWWIVSCSGVKRQVAVETQSFATVEQTHSVEAGGLVTADECWEPRPQRHSKEEPGQSRLCRAKCDVVQSGTPDYAHK